MKKAIVILWALFAFAIGNAQSGSDTVISLITAFPGSDIYELEGHSALRVNMGPGSDYAVSYGLFDFNAPNFVYRFVKGETDYMVGAVPFDLFLESYRAHNRRVEELPLNLTQSEKTRLVDLLSENLKPENRVYRYNYVKDNCSTRPLKMVEMSLDTTLCLPPFEMSGANTFRGVMRRYHKNYPWYQFGIDLALGSGIDYPLESREYTFAPVLMARQLQQATVGGSKLADEPVALVDFDPDSAVLPGTPWWLSPGFVCWLFFALIMAAVVRDVVRRKISRWIDAVYFAVMGMAGLLLTFLIFVSVHEATSPNYLYLWLNPLCLIPPIFIWFKKCRGFVRWYQIFNIIVVGLALILWPLIPQSANPAFLPLVLADLALAGRYVALAKSAG